MVVALVGVLLSEEFSDYHGCSVDANRLMAPPRIADKLFNTISFNAINRDLCGKRFLLFYFLLKKKKLFAKFPRLLEIVHCSSEVNV